MLYGCVWETSGSYEYIQKMNKYIDIYKKIKQPLAKLEKLNIEILYIYTWTENMC